MVRDLAAYESGETELLHFAAVTLEGLLGEGWVVGRQNVATEVDGALTVSGPDRGHEATILLEVKNPPPSPSMAQKLADQLNSYLQMIDEQAVAVVVSPWLSPRTRQVLDENGVGYLDETGNISLRLAEPAVFIRVEGEQRNPRPQPGVRRGISGSRAGLVVRQLVDFRPPRRAAELAEASGISESYISRLLEILSEEALIRRKQRVIITVDWPNLLRARAESYQLMKVNRVVPVVARKGLQATMDALSSGSARHQVFMTGIAAAERYAPFVVGGALQLYVPPGDYLVVEEVMKDLGLLPAPHRAAAAIQLLQPADDGPLQRPARSIDRVPTVGLSQLVLDCLSGPGRMPAAGEAMISWMQEHEDEWRRAGPAG